MSPKSLTLVLRGLPSDFEEQHVSYQIRPLVDRKSCTIALGPIVDTPNGTRSMTCTIAGSKSEGFEKRLHQLEVSSNSQTCEIEADPIFWGTTLLSSDANPVADIYFVHGLGGHAFHTWSSGVGEQSLESLKVWPRDFLPDALRQEKMPCNIYTVGYGARIVGKADVSSTIQTCAEELLSRLLAERLPNSAASRRPMYFVCHSLGGLVICKMLNMILMPDNLHSQMAERHRNTFINSDDECLVKGLVFLGTPFKGSMTANMLKPLISILAKANPFPTNTALLEELRYDNDGRNDLSKISNTTNIVVGRNSIDVLIGYESDPMAGRRPVTERDSALGIFKNRVLPIGLHGDHRQIVKFPSKNNDYETLKNRIVGMIRNKSTPPPSQDRRPPLVVDPRMRVDSHALENSPGNRPQVRTPSPGISRASTVAFQPAQNTSSHNNITINIPGYPFHHGMSQAKDDTSYVRPFSHYGGNPTSGQQQHQLAFQQQQLKLSQQAQHEAKSRSNDSTNHGTDLMRDRYNDSGAFARLAMFDTVFILDDSASMQAPADSEDNNNSQMRWTVLEESLHSTIHQATEYDKDGIDVFFLKNDDFKLEGVTKANVDEVFQKMNTIRSLLSTDKCSGGTFYLTELRRAIEPRLTAFRNYNRERAAGTNPHLMLPKHLNLIVVTDGQADDMEEVEEYIAAVAEELDTFAPKAPRNYIGIQFLQIGDDPTATDWLKELDDNLKSDAAVKVRDMVDTTPFLSRNTLNPGGFTELLKKVLLGAVVKAQDKISIDTIISRTSPPGQTPSQPPPAYS